MNGTKYTKWMLLGLGAGVAAGFLAQSEFGKKKGPALAREARKLLNKAAHEGKKSLRDSGHRLTGLAAEVWTSLKHNQPSDHVLEERIRSHIGRVVSHPRNIHIVCDKGTAILWGVIAEPEIARLIEVVESVRGVNEVVDHLEPVKADELPAGQPNILKDARDEITLNWSPSKRMVVGTAGATLAAYGWRRGDRLGSAMAVLGAGMVARSTMQKHLRATLALTDSSPGFELQRTITIKAPISDLFDFWANPENYPKVFSHVTRIERMGENLYRWTIAGPAGVPVGWEGVITRSIPNTLVEWKSLPGSTIGNFGVVHFDPNYDASTRITIRMFYRPPAGILGRFFAEMLGADARQILNEDLKRLKYLFENEAFVEEQKQIQKQEDDLLRTATT